MARLLGPDPSTRRALIVTPGWQVEGLPDRQVTLYTDEAAETLADVAAYDGTATPGADLDSKVRIDGDSMVPLFWFPDGVDTLWAVDRRGNKLKLTADLDARMDVVQRAAGTSGLKVPPGWGQHWYAALAEAKAGTGTAVVAFVGSSVAQGYYASNPRETSMPALVRAGLQEYAGDGGSGFEGMQWSDTFLAGAPAGAKAVWDAADVPWAQTGTWSTPTFWHGPACGFLQGNSGSTVTVPFTGDEADLWFYNAFGESFTYAVAGGGPAGTVTAGAGYGPDFSPQFETVTGCGDGDHTVTITAGGAGCKFVGVRGRNAAGVLVDNFGIAGMESYAWSNLDVQNAGTYMGGWRVPADVVVIEYPFNDIIKATQTFGGTGTTSGSATITNSLFRLADVGRVVSGAGIPRGATIVSVNQGTSATLDLAATATGTVSVTLTDPDPVGRWVSHTQTYLDGVLDDMYAGNVKFGAVDIIFTIPVIRQSSDPTRIKAQVAQAMYGLAEFYGAAVVNTGVLSRQSWIYAQQQGLMGNSGNPAVSGSDDVHPSDAGFQVVADELLKILLPSQ